MLIGNRNRFALELAPVEPSWDSRYAPERAAWAGLSIWVDGKNLCAHVRPGEEAVRTALYVPLGPVADWFVRVFPGLAFEERFPWVDQSSAQLHQVIRKWGESPPLEGLDEETWLDHREAFWTRHFLLAGADGARLPNLAILRQDEHVRLVWAKPPSADAAGLTFVNAEGSFVAAWRDIEAVLSQFVEEVAAAFQQKSLVTYDWIRAPQPRLRALLRNQSLEPLAFYCARPLAQIGELLDVTEAELLHVLGSDARENPAASALCQILRDLPPQPSSGVGPEARTTVDTSSAEAARTESWLRAREDARDAARAAQTPIEAGILAATALRHELELDGDPVGGMEELLDRFGIIFRQSACEAQHEHMLIAAAPGHKPVARTVATGL
jgi:hypothetical protein